MRLLLALLAVLGLLASPVTAAAAQASCDHCPMAISGMPAMPGQVHVADSTAKGDPCCDPSGQGRKSGHRSCTAACAAACAGVVALPASFLIEAPPPARAPLDLPILTSAQGLEPAGLERPPKSIA